MAGSDKKSARSSVSSKSPNRRPRSSGLSWMVVTALALSLGCKTLAADLVEQPPEVTGPFPENYVEIVRSWIDTDFYDVSVVTGLQISTPISGHSSRWPSRKRLYGWYSKVTFKARDSVGASKGTMAYSVLLHDGAVIASRKLLY